MCDSVRLLFFLFFFFLRGVQHGRVLSSSLFVLEALSIYGLSSTGVLLLLLLVDTTLRNQAQEILCHVHHRAAEVGGAALHGDRRSKTSPKGGFEFAKRWESRLPSPTPPGERRPSSRLPFLWRHRTGKRRALRI